MSDDLIRAVVITLGVVMITFGVVFFGWLTYRLRGEDPAVMPWGIANGAFHVAVGAVVLCGAFLPGAVPYAVASVVVLLVARFLARRRLLKGGGGLG